MLRKLICSLLLGLLVQGCTSKTAAPVVSLPVGASKQRETAFATTQPVEAPPKFNVQVEDQAAPPQNFATEKPQPPFQSEPVPAEPPSNTPMTEPQQAEMKADNKTKPTMPSIQWQWPCDGRVRSSFKPGDSEGIEIGGEVGAPVRAAASGEVVYRGNGLPDYGNMLIIKHNDEFLSAYAHNQKLLVKEKEQVKAGQVIAEMGRNTSNQPGLHFEIRYQGEPVDPMLYLPR